MIGSNQFAITCGGLALAAMEMKQYLEKNGQAYYFTYKTNISGPAVLNFINAFTKE